MRTTDGNPLTPVSLYLNYTDVDRIRDLAESAGQPVSTFLREIVNDFLKEAQ